MEFSFIFKDVITSSERFTRSIIVKLILLLPSLWTKTIYANAENLDAKHTQEKKTKKKNECVFFFPTGCIAELADVLLLHGETL